MLSTDANLICFENRLARIGLSPADGRVAYIVDKHSGENVAAPGGGPFVVARKHGGAEAAVSRLARDGDTVRVRLDDGGEFALRIDCRDRYFAFELTEWRAPAVTELYFGCLAVGETADRLGVGVFGAAMTVLVDPVEFPDFHSRRTRGRIVPKLGAVGARYAAAVAPFSLRKGILEEIFGDVDRETGIVSSTGGVHGRDSAVNFGNYTIQFDSSPEFVRRNLPFFREIGVDQIDFHKGSGTFRQGDFAFRHYADAADFRQHVTKTLEDNGLCAGLHTYSHYIDYDCDPLLSDRRCREQLKVMDTFTLGKSVDAAETNWTVEEDTAGLSVDFGFCVVNTPFLLVDDELVRYRGKTGHGLLIAERGLCGTKPATHKKGAAVKHLEGRYFGLTPVLGSELFRDIARRTARTFNEGGFRMIYLDALDGIASHCDAKTESSLYIAAFVHEVLKNCARDPLLEGSTYPPSMWAARGRTGAWDTPARAYKRFNTLHTESNKAFIDRFGVPILGWYDFYPLEERYPGNEHVKYQHTDDIDHMGALAVAYDFPTVFNGLTPEALDRFPALRRNVFRYKQYDELRKTGVVPEAVREQLRTSGYEHRLLPANAAEPGHVRPAFQEAVYAKVKLYDLADANRNCAAFTNPFRAQRPFVRIEALLSAEAEDVYTLVGANAPHTPLAFPATIRFDRELNISHCLAKHLRIRGNGQPGGKLAVKLRCATEVEKGVAEYVVDTGFNGERDFLLIETDNGERTDHAFEQGEDLYAIYRAPFNHDRVTGLSIEAEGNTDGVELSPLTTRVHKYIELRNPALRIGATAVTFDCLLRSTEFIEFNGTRALVLDRYGNCREIGFESTLTAPEGEFTAVLTSAEAAGAEATGSDAAGSEATGAEAAGSEATGLEAYTKRAVLTLGFYGAVTELDGVEPGWSELT